MYNFSYFKETNQDEILRFINENPLGLLSGCFLDGQPVASQIPVLIQERNGDLYLQGHMMKNTDHHKALLENPNALMVFTGPDCYVSASWYKNPQIGSTWNYMSVHARGKLKFMEESELVMFMKKFTLYFEKGNSSSKTIYDNLPPEFLSKMMPAIAGFEIKVEKLDNVFKLSQNRDKESYLNIIEKLKSIGGKSELIAKEMENRIEQLFPDGEVWDASKFDS